MRRRGLVIAGLAALLLASEQSAGQQAQSKIPRVGILSLADRTSTKIFDAFLAAPRPRPTPDDKKYHHRIPACCRRFSRLPVIAGELVRLPVECHRR